jgi:hypothetical protein
MFPTKDVEKIEAHILCSITFFSENRAVYEIIWKNTVQPDRLQRHTTAHALCVLDKEGYRHTLRICVTYCIFKVTVTTRTRLNVALSVHSLSCYYSFLYNTILKAKNQIDARWKFNNMNYDDDYYYYDDMALWILSWAYSVAWLTALCFRSFPPDPQNKTPEGYRWLQPRGRWATDKRITRTLLGKHMVVCS